MQLFALDKKKKIASAKYAHRGVDYYCRECEGVVRLRGGARKQSHFYHLALSPSCRQNGKSLMHLQVQYTLQAMLPHKECGMERHFPVIGRIADFVWENEKIVFEVQCSPISREEMEGRNRDYASCGYQVIWILHDRTFNKSKPGAAEVFLLEHPHYFTNIDSEGAGEIYDQLSICHPAFRKPLKRIGRINLSQLRKKAAHFQPKLPKTLRARLQSWPVYFSGDLIDGWLCADKKIIDAALLAYEYEASFYEKAAGPLNFYFKKLLGTIFVKPYLLIFQLLLERMSR